MLIFLSMVCRNMYS